MHAAFMLLKESNFMSLSPLRSLAVLASTLAMDVASTGLEDAEICDAKDPLALKYCFSRPQRQAALAAMLEVAYTVEGANIFKTLSDDECAALRGACALVISPSPPLVVSSSHLPPLSPLVVSSSHLHPLSAPSNRPLAPSRAQASCGRASSAPGSSERATSRTSWS